MKKAGRINVFTLKTLINLLMMREEQKKRVESKHPGYKSKGEQKSMTYMTSDLLLSSKHSGNTIPVYLHAA